MTAVSASSRTPWWLWPQVLCLDAPLVAVSWMAALAKSHHLRLQPSFYIGLGLVTWIVYVLDRTADAISGRLPTPLTARHEFCLHHRKLLLRVLVPVASGYAVWLFLTDMPQGLLIQGLGLCVAAAFYLAAFSATHGALRIMMFVLAMVAGLMLFALLPAPGKVRIWLSAMLVVAVVSALRTKPDEKLRALVPKELAASLLFTLGCSAGVHLWTPPEHGMFCHEVQWFWALVLINLLGIQWRERIQTQLSAPLPWPLMLLIGGLLCFTLQAWLSETATVVRALALISLLSASAHGLLLIMARRLRPELFHTLSDLVLLLPIPLLWWLG